MNHQQSNLREAALWDSADGDKAQCKLCAHRCLIANGRVGFCQVRKNIDGTLYSLNYDKIVAANPDPIEKKPLFHFQPGTRSFSIAAPGCNFRCEFCQNWQISQMALEQAGIDGQAISPQEIVDSAIRSGCKSIAYTYTEPTIFMELCVDCGRLAKEKGLSNVFVSNGYMTPEAIDFAKDWLDGINIDLKAFDERYYKKLCKAKLEPVKETIRYIAKHTDIWMEITTLLVPGQNTDAEQVKQIAEFIARDASPDIPWHISRFYPQYKFDHAEPTPISVMEKACEIGKAAGLKYIYLGNVPGSDSENTFCSGCGQMLIERVGYRIGQNLIAQGRCPKCNAQISGYQLS